MKEGLDREIDLLLRRRARGTAELRSWGDDAGDGAHNAHLDADELGAFAEGALPAAARVAAASHLAECERCRGVVVGLARVAGFEVKPQAVAAVASTEATRPSAWRALVASLFAPRMLRYATPVLALALVATVSYVALRSDKGAVQMAREGRRAGTLQEPSAAPAASNTDAANANVASVADSNANAAPREATAAGTQPSAPKGHGGADAQPAETDTASEVARPSVASPPPPPPAAAEGPAELSKAAPKTATTEEGEARADNKEKAENRDKSVRGAEPVDDVAANDAIAQQRAVRSRAANEVQMPDGGARNQSKRGADNNASSGYGNVGGAGTTSPPRESERDAPGRARPAKRAERKADEDERGAQDGQTRSAAGHRFRREGSAWVDVNYKSTMPSTGVRRGTEPFRALVAKVPEVGRVAEIISGEVTVVVNGRAYNIR